MSNIMFKIILNVLSNVDVNRNTCFHTAEAEAKLLDANVLQLLELKMDSFTKSQRKAADYIIKNPTEAAFVTIEELSKLAHTSTGTIIRLTAFLEYPGYVAFQKDLQKLLRSKVVPNQNLTAHLKPISQNSLMLNCAKTQLENIKNTAEFLSDELIDAALDMIISAEKIYVIGVRASASTANYLYEGLIRVTGNCEFLTPDSIRLQDVLLGLSNTDLVIAVSLPRYAKRTFEIAQTAQKRGARVLGITDGYSSPLVSVADIFLPCAANTLSFHYSQIGAMFIADFLITAIAAQYPDQAQKRLREIEKLNAQLGTNLG